MARVNRARLFPCGFPRGASVDPDVAEQPARMSALPATSTVAELANALNGLGVKPRDLVAIFHALKAAGALAAEIKVL